MPGQAPEVLWPSPQLPVLECPVLLPLIEILRNYHLPNSHHGNWFMLYYLSYDQVTDWIGSDQ